MSPTKVKWRTELKKAMDAKSGAKVHSMKEIGQMINHMDTASLLGRKITGKRVTGTMVRCMERGK